MKYANRISDVIFPICVVNKQGTNYTYKALVGTGFILGENGFAMTARHVIENIEPEKLCGLLIINDKWDPIFFESMTHHPNEDISILKIKENKIKSFIYPSKNFENASCPYQLWGYPEINAYFHSEIKDCDVNSLHRPDLCYYEGHIVRRLSDAREHFLRRNWCNVYEIPPGFKGCSGAPLIKKASRTDEKCEMLGIYVGNKANQPKRFLKFLQDNGDTEEFKNILENKENISLINAIDSYMAQCSVDIAGFAIREDSIRSWLKEIDSSLYE